MPHRDPYIEKALANDGWMTIGRGGAMLHYAPGCTLSGMGRDGTAEIIAAGVPTCDSNGMDFDDVWDLAVRGPMPGFVADTFGTNPDGSLSTRPWRVIFNRYAARGGAVFHNYEPTPEPWAPAKVASHDD